MEKELRIHLLRSGGKKALKKFNDSKRVPTAPFNIGTRTHADLLYKKPKHKNQEFEE